MMRRIGLTLLYLIVVVCARAASTGDGVTTRIVSLMPSVTEILFALGARDQVAGVSDYCKYPPEAAALPRAGALLNPNIEQMLLLRPTLVVAYRSQVELAAKLDQLGVRSCLISCDNTSEVLRLIRDVGGWTGREAAAERLADDLVVGLDALTSAGAGRRHPSVLLVVSRDASSLASIYAATANSYHGELLARAGGENVIGALPLPTIPVSKEELIRLDPEVIIDMSVAESVATGWRHESHKAVWGQLSTLRAVRSGRVLFLGDPHLLVPGLSAVKAARAMNRLLHGGSTKGEASAP